MGNYVLPDYEDESVLTKKVEHILTLLDATCLCRTVHSLLCKASVWLGLGLAKQYKAQGEATASLESLIAEARGVVENLAQVGTCFIKG